MTLKGSRVNMVNKTGIKTDGMNMLSVPASQTVIEIVVYTSQSYHLLQRFSDSNSH